MKSKLTTALLAFVLWMNASAQVTDTIDYPLMNGVNGSGFVTYLDSIGYYNGTGLYISHLGQYYTWPGTATVTGVIIWCSAKKRVGTADSYNIQVYNPGADSLPTGAALATKAFTTDQMDSSGTYGGVSTFTFSSPPTITNQFVITLEVSGTGKNDTLGYVSNYDGDGLGRGMSMFKLNSQFGGTWNKYLDLGNDFDLIILPIIQYTPGGCNLSLTSSNIVSNTSCSTPNGSFSVNPANGTSPYQFNCSCGTNNTTGIFNGLSGGSYTVTATDANSCTATRTVTVGSTVSNMTVSVSNIVANTSCTNPNGNFDLTFQGGTLYYTISLTGPVSGTIPSNFGITPGTYNYQSYASILSLPPLPGGNYVLSVTDGSGCTKSTSFVIPDVGGVTLNVTNTQANTTCGNVKNGQVTLSVSGGNTPYDYYLDNGQTGSFSNGTYTITSLPSGSYNITVENQASCSKTTTFTIGNNTPAITINNVSINGNSSCSAPFTGAFQVAASGGASPYTYSVAGLPSNTNGSFTTLASGSYTVLATDVNGCSNSKSLTVPNQSGSNLAVSVSNIVPNGSCTNPNGGFTLNIAGGAAPYVLTYPYSTGVTQVFSTGSFTNAQLGITGWGGSYSITVTDYTNCSAVVSFTVPESVSRPDLNVISITSNTRCYFPYTGGITVSSGGGTGNLYFTANSGNGNYDGIFTGLAGGQYLMRVQDDIYCFDTLTVSIPEPLAFTITVNVTNASSQSASDGSASVTVTGGTAPFNYNIYDYNFNLVSTTSSATGLPIGIYSVEVSDANNCSKSEYFNVGTGPVGIANDMSIASVKVFPNPGDDHLGFTISLNRPDRVTVEMINALGIKVIDEIYEGGSLLTGTFDVSPFAAGLYFVKVSTPAGFVIKKITLR